MLPCDLGLIFSKDIPCLSSVLPQVKSYCIEKLLIQIITEILGLHKNFLKFREISCKYVGMYNRLLHNSTQHCHAFPFSSRGKEHRKKLRILRGVIANCPLKIWCHNKHYMVRKSIWQLWKFNIFAFCTNITIL